MYGKGCSIQEIYCILAMCGHISLMYTIFFFMRLHPILVYGMCERYKMPLYYASAV